MDWKQLLLTGLRELNSEHEFHWICQDFTEKRIPDFEGETIKLLERKKRGEPLAYILGHWDFRKLRLKVGPGVLIPRPETEELVDHALTHLDSLDTERPVVADMGAGSGAISYSIVQESHKKLQLFSVEKSLEAFGYLQQNSELLSPEEKGRVRLVNKDWKTFHERLDLMVSNPPYVSSEEYAALDPEVRQFEPKEALVPEEWKDPHSAYRTLFLKAEELLKPGGAILFEFGPAQAAAWEQLVPSSFRWRVFKDLSGKPRCLYCFDFRPKTH